MKAGSHRSDTVASLAAALLLVAAMLFGGGSRGAGDLVVHLAAVPALVIALLRWRLADSGRMPRLFLCWLAAAVALVALQLLPLPAAWFARLPQRAAVLADLRQAGMDPAWLPMSLDRWGTLRALLALIAFASMWLLVSTLAHPARVRLVQLAVLVAVALALLGFAQASAAEHSPLRFYAYHHGMGAIGTFANRNHFASLLGMLVPMALALAVQAQRARSRWMPLWYASAVLLLLASALTFSRAGFALTCVALVAAAVALFWRRQGRPRRLVPALAGLAAVLAVGYYAWGGLMQRLQQDPLADLRWQYLRHGREAALQYLPWGSGLGSFPWAYAPLEPVSAMVPVFAERAHNDLLQIVIEAGLPGALLLVALVAWLLCCTARIILMGRRGALADDSLARAALVTLYVPLLHSLVDYPLRTLSVAMVFAVLLTLIQGTHRAQRPGAGEISR